MNNIACKSFKNDSNKLSHFKIRIGKSIVSFRFDEVYPSVWIVHGDPINNDSLFYVDAVISCKIELRRIFYYLL